MIPIAARGNFHTQLTIAEKTQIVRICHELGSFYVFFRDAPFNGFMPIFYHKISDQKLINEETRNV